MSLNIQLLKFDKNAPTVKKILVSYQSKHGTTKKYAEGIATFLNKNAVKATAKTISDCTVEEIEACDAILFGCWTHGLMIFLQHPEKKWVEFAKKLPALENKKVGLFTTYKLATGSMFKKMASAFEGKKASIDLEIKSKNGLLSAGNEEALIKFIN